MLVVMLLAGIAAGVVVVSLGGPLRRMRQETTLERIAAVEDRLRARAVLQGRPQLLRFQFEPPSMAYGDADASEEELDRFDLPEGWKFESICVDGRRVWSGDVELWIDARGRSSTYGVRLTLPERPAAMFVVLGVTGRRIRWEDERAWETLLASPTTGAFVD